MDGRVPGARRPGRGIDVRDRAVWLDKRV